MLKKERFGLLEFMRGFSTEQACREYLSSKRWPPGFVCPKCGAQHGQMLAKGHIQCAGCRYQAFVTAGTVMHRSHLPLTKWFLAFYLMRQDKRGISAVQLSRQLDVTYKAAWYLLHRVRKAMGQRNSRYLLSGIVEFDDAYFGGPTVGKKRGRGTEKSKVFVAVSLNDDEKPKHLCMQLTKNLKQASVKKFAKTHIQNGSIVRADAYRSYPPALNQNYTLEAQPYDPHTGELHWLHTLVSNVKVFILGTYHGLPKKNMQSYLDEFCSRFSRGFYFGQLFDRLTIAVASSG
jgi:transposase-like protein/DNA-directed RNA polymerase subunit RPC12/RpoP